MAKEVYRIPDSLDKNMMDMEITIRSSSGVGLRPIPIKIILGYVLSAIVCFIIVARSFIAAGGVGMCILFVLVWIALTVTLLKTDKSGIPQASLIASMITYWPKHMRYVLTRNNSNAYPFLGITGIDDIDKDNGMITFLDGTVGFMYMVVGNGSRLLFSADKKAIIDRVDSFYRKLQPDCQIIYITNKEGQKVYRQVAALQKRYNSLKSEDTELRQLCEAQFHMLKHNIAGGSFRSIHQYMILKAENREALLQARNMLEGEVENSSMMFKQCVAMYSEDITDVLSKLYRTGD